MNRHSVVFKLFIANLAFYVVFFAVVMIGHLGFFERFYQNQRVVELEKEITGFARGYANRNWSGGELEQAMAGFISNNHVQLAIVDAVGNTLHDNPFRIHLRQDDGGSMSIPVSLFSQVNQLESYGLLEGDRLVVVGEYNREWDVFLPYVLGKEDSADTIGSLPAHRTNAHLLKIGGTVESLLMPAPGQWNQREGVMMAARKVWLPLQDDQQIALLEGQILREEWTEPASGVHNLVFIKAVSAASGEPAYLFALAPLTQLREAFSALERYYALFIIAGGLLLSIVLSFVFSKLVSRPLILLNQSAGHLARLDFSSGAPMIRSRDELGSLSESLQILSSNLHQALQELRSANERLLEEMDYKNHLQELQKKFVSDASHELKTPISIIKGFAEGLQDQIAEHKRERYVNTIWLEADRMEKLVGEMLELIRLESGTVQLERQSFPLGALLEQAAAKLAPLAREKHLRISVSGEINRFVNADSKLIEQALLNLLSNAIRHADPHTAIAVDARSAASGRLRVSVNNAGQTIPEAQLPLLWDRFYRGEESRNRKNGGTGLGLAIVKEIMQRHDMPYGVDNTDNGVQFHFCLPLAPTAAERTSSALDVLPLRKVGE